MDIFGAIGLVGGIASVVGLLYAIYYARQNRKIKLLVYDVSIPVPLAKAVSPEDNYTLSVAFQRTGQTEERIKSVYVRFLKFANLGKEPIRREDIAPANPMKISVDGVRTLDIALAGESRPVTRVALSRQTISEIPASANVTFDFLDCQDGGLVKILTEGGEGRVKISGDIIGMPDGIRRRDEVGSLGLLNKMGCMLAVVLQLTAVVLAVFIFHWVTGSWNKVWLLGLPYLALFIPVIIVAIIAATIWPGERISFPRGLQVPDWFRLLEMSQRSVRPRDINDLEFRFIEPPR